MSTIIEIERAIEKLSPAQVDELAAWIEMMRAQRSPPSVDAWLAKARGAGIPCTTTAEIMALTRGEE